MITDTVSSLLLFRATGDLSHRMLLTPCDGRVQDKGFRVALVTKDRISGASGKVPAAIHCSPETLGGGPLKCLRDGDVDLVRAARGLRHRASSAELSGSAMLAAREQVG